MSHSTPVYEWARRIFTIEEAARYLRCSRRTIERLIERGELSTVRVASRRRIRLDELHRYLERDREPV
jgi:excisionase family DNA binding protein